MEELIRIIAQGLVEDKDAVKVVADAPDEEGVVVYHLHVASEDREGSLANRAVSLKRSAL